MKTLIILALSSIGVFAAEVDYFTRLDSVNLNSNWCQSGGFDIFMNTLRSVGAASANMAEWCAGSAPNADQFSYAVSDSGWDARNGGATGGMAFRMDAANRNGYACTPVAQNVGVRVLRIIKVTNGVESTLVAGTASVFSIPDNSRVRGWSVGTTHNCTLTDSAGVDLTAPISTTDSTYSSGRVGVYRTSSSMNIVWREWWGGSGTGSDIFIPPTVAGSFFISPTATSHNASGTQLDPWPFLDFFEDQSRVPCGSIVWQRGGTYSHDRTSYDPIGAFFKFTRSCTAGTEIIYKNFPGEELLYDAAAPCVGNSGYALIIVTGNYTILDGGFNSWRMTNSDGSCRVLTTCGSNPTPNPIRALFNQADHVIYRGLVWHDFGDGLADNGANADGTRFQGQIVFHIGWNAPDRGHGHGCYTHSDAWATIRKYIIESFFFRNQEFGCKIFSQSGAPVGNYLIDSTAFLAGRNDAGTRRGTGTGTSFLVQGSNPENIHLNEVYTVAGDIRFNVDAVNAPGLRITNSIIDGGFGINQPNGAVVTGNIFSRFGTPNGSAWFNSTTGVSWETAWLDYDFNTFYAPRTGGNGFTNNSNVYQWSAYQALGLNASSTYDNTNFPAVGASPSGSATNYIRVRPSTVTPGTGNVMVYNWKNLSAVDADVSTILKVGDPYEVLDVQCWSCGPIATGIYAGGNISLDMTLTTIQAPVGNDTASPGSTCTAGSDGGVVAAHDDTLYQHTESYFGIFLVRRRQVYGTTNLSWRGSPADVITYGILSPTGTINWTFGPSPIVSCVAGLCSAEIPSIAGKLYYRMNGFMPLEIRQ